MLPSKNAFKLSFRHQAWWRVGLFLLALISAPVSSQTLDIDGTELWLDITPATQAQPKARFLWLVSEYGVLSAEKQLAEALAQQGIESWHTDLFEALLLSPTASALDVIPSELVAKLIQQAHTDDVPLLIIAPNKAAQLAVRGLHLYQQTPRHQLAVIFINPNLYLETPAPGDKPIYWPQTKTLNLPSWVIQAELSPWRWQLVELEQQLSTSGSPVFLQLLQQVRDRFYFRPDALDIEQHTLPHLAQHLLEATQRLTDYMTQPRSSGKLEQTFSSLNTPPPSDSLQPYQGAQQRDFQLVDLTGQTHRLSDYQGKVVLLNFWASWCPPCLHEMPSMTRLKSLLAERDFEILAVNLAEQPEDFADFLAKNPVNFPILLDPKGQAIQDWRIIAYPTTYLIDRQGQLRFALFGGTEWDQPHHLEIIHQLLDTE